MGSNHMNEQFRNNKRNNKKKEEPITPPVRNEIPMYDPQTGEPNPHYEELTGKPNPLIEIRKTTKDSHFLMPDHEPKRKNRFLVHFPDELGIAPWCVSKTQRPSVKIKEKKFLGIRMGVTTEWEKISFEFIDPISPSVAEKLADLMENGLVDVFTYKLEMLDPTGVVVETWIIEDCEIEAISLGTLDYGLDDIARCYMLVKPGSVKLQKII